MEYLLNDVYASEQMEAFVALYPWVLTEPAVCINVVTQPDCYHTLKKFKWWDTVLEHVASQENLVSLWKGNSHVHALAYEATDAQIKQTLDWPAWKQLVRQYGPYGPSSDETPFSRAKALVELANRMDMNLAPLMCAAMHLLLPLNKLSDIVNAKWNPLQKAQYGWLLQKIQCIDDTWITPPQYRAPLIRAQGKLFQWINLVESHELAGLHVVYELNNSDLHKTIRELIQLAQQAPNVDSFDYTHALDNTCMVL